MELQHVSHEHPLILKEQVELQRDTLEHPPRFRIHKGQVELRHIEKKGVCNGCGKPIVGGRSASGYAAIYVCIRDGCDFYLHKTCAELPHEIEHPLHDQHFLTLHARLPHYGTNNRQAITCDSCRRDSKWFTYTCLSCNFDVCLTCKDRLIRHEGHKHELTFWPRKALFLCDACGMNAEDFFYACHACAFWIHSTCAFSPTTITPSFHHHPLFLKYSLPLMDRTSTAYCDLCSKEVLERSWVYYCDLCRYYVHMECGTLSEKEYYSRYREKEIADHNIPNLIHLPVDNKESLLDLRTDHIYINPQLIYHESHGEHALLLLEEFKSFKNNDDEILCDGCAKPISTAHPFYGCIGCSFFLHRVCSELPPELSVGECPCHREHSLSKHRVDKFFNLVKCAVCVLKTNGFCFRCETCNFTVDTCCAFLPTKIKHDSHKHPLVQHAPSPSPHFSRCKACGLDISRCTQFRCKTCSSFRIDINCAQYPSRVRHRWDPHPIPLIYPPFFYQGIIYCEICEEEVDPKLWLYHCGECDQSFHTYCLNPPHNVKLGSTLLVLDIHPHILTFAQKTYSDYLSQLCSRCDNFRFTGFNISLMLECARCEFLLCLDCVRETNL